MRRQFKINPIGMHGRIRLQNNFINRAQRPIGMKKLSALKY